MKRLIGAIAASLILLAAALLTSSPASAADPSCTGTCSGTTTVQIVSDACAQLQQAHDLYGTDIPAGMCDGDLETITEDYSTGPAFTPTSTLRAAACAPGGCENPVQCKSWRQTAKSALNGAFWNETHKGVFCFNTTTVWAPPASKYSQTTYHHCNINDGVGFTVTNLGCTGNLLQSGSRQQWDDFRVNFILKGVPVSGKHEMHVRLDSGTGKVTYVVDN